MRNSSTLTGNTGRHENADDKQNEDEKGEAEGEEWFSFHVICVVHIMRVCTVSAMTAAAEWISPLIQIGIYDTLPCKQIAEWVHIFFFSSDFIFLVFHPSAANTLAIFMRLHPLVQWFRCSLDNFVHRFEWTTGELTNWLTKFGESITYNDYFVMEFLSELRRKKIDWYTLWSDTCYNSSSSSFFSSSQVWRSVTAIMATTIYRLCWQLATSSTCGNSNFVLNEFAWDI